MSCKFLFLFVAHLQLSDAIHGKRKREPLFVEIQTPVFDLQPPDEEDAADLNMPPPNLSVQ